MANFLLGCTLASREQELSVVDSICQVGMKFSLKESILFDFCLFNLHPLFFGFVALSSSRNRYVSTRDPSTQRQNAPVLAVSKVPRPTDTVIEEDPTRRAALLGDTPMKDILEAEDPGEFSNTQDTLPGGEIRTTCTLDQSFLGAREFSAKEEQNTETVESSSIITDKSGVRFDLGSNGEDFFWLCTPTASFP